MNSIDEIRKELLELPSGYISIKTISNKKYYYLKYYDNGKQISKYIKNDEIKSLKEKLKRRKQLEKLIKEYDIHSSNLAMLSNNAKNLTGSIMMGDTKVATYQDGRLTFKNDSLCPLLIKRTNNINEFLKGRVIDTNRTNSRLLRKVLNINTSNEEYISLYAHGAVITDNYWFRPKGSRLKYKDICFNSDYYSDLALKGELAFYPKSPKHSPQLTAIGSFEKCWKMIDGEWWLYKKGTDEQIFSELFCSLLASELNIVTAIYEYDDGYIKTKNFANKYNFEPMLGLVGDDESYNTIFNTLLDIDKDMADQYLLLSFFDCVINNVDRHNENLGLMRDKKTGKIVSLAPNFDNNLALLGYDKKLNMQANKDGFIYLFIKFINTNDEAKIRFKKLKIKIINKDTINKCINKIPIAIKDIDITNYVLNRYNYLINYKNKL